jgi:hypothetical protein
MQASEDEGRRDDELALGCRIFPRRRAFRLAHLFENAPACGDIGFPRLGEGKLPGGAMQQPGSQVRFQLRHLAAHCGERHLELARRGGKAACFDHGHQDRHGFQTIRHVLNF